MRHKKISSYIFSHKQPVGCCPTIPRGRVSVYKMSSSSPEQVLQSLPKLEVDHVEDDVDAAVGGHQKVVGVEQKDLKPSGHV